MKTKQIIFFLFAALVAGGTWAQELAVPNATNLNANTINTISFPFDVTGGFDTNPQGLWQAGNSTVKGSFELSYKLEGKTGLYGQKIEKTASVDINGHWKMEGFSVTPPADAYDVEYTLFIFHYNNGRESLGKAYKIIPDSKYIKKYGTIKLAKKPGVFVKPIPRSEMNRIRKKINWVKLNPQPIPPKNAGKLQLQ